MFGLLFVDLVLPIVMAEPLKGSALRLYPLKAIRHIAIRKLSVGPFLILHEFVRGVRPRAQCARDL
jgi:hypothetical protein